MSDPAETLAAQILTDARKQVEPILKHARREADNILRRARQDAQRERTELVARAERDAATQALRVRARTELELANIRRQAMEEILLHAREMALDALRRQGQAGDYRGQLVRLALAALRHMDGERFELVMRQEEKGVDAEGLARAVTGLAAAELGRRVEIAVADDTVNAIGGMLLRSADGHQVCDQTYEARLDRLWDRLREEIAGDLLSGTL